MFRIFLSDTRLTFTNYEKKRKSAFHDVYHKTRKTKIGLTIVWDQTRACNVVFYTNPYAKKLGETLLGVGGERSLRVMYWI